MKNKVAMVSLMALVAAVKAREFMNRMPFWDSGARDYMTIRIKNGG